MINDLVGIEVNKLIKPVCKEKEAVILNANLDEF